MKSIIALTLLISSGSFACSTYEAQFSSVIKEVTADPENPYACFIKIDINLSQAAQSWQPHMMCPLSIEEVSHEFILVRHCSYKVGQKVSGYLIQTEQGLELE
jgi:hypothetical protein